MAILVKIPNVKGDAKMKGFDDGWWFTAESFSFNIERELTESGGKGGTEDINIGVGECQECSISKSMDSASMDLAQMAISGNSLGTADICFVQTFEDSSGKPSAEIYLRYKLDTCFVKSWNTSGSSDDRPTEDVTFFYNRIVFAYRQVKKGGNKGEWGPQKEFRWDNVANVKDWVNPSSPMEINFTKPC